MLYIIRPSNCEGLKPCSAFYGGQEKHTSTTIWYTTLSDSNQTLSDSNPPKSNSNPNLSNSNHLRFNSNTLKVKVRSKSLKVGFKLLCVRRVVQVCLSTTIAFTSLWRNSLPILISPYYLLAAIFGYILAFFHKSHIHVPSPVSLRCLREKWSTLLLPLQLFPMRNLIISGILVLAATSHLRLIAMPKPASAIYKI